MSKLAIVFLFLFSVVINPFSADAQNQEKLDLVIKKINSGSKYLAGVLLDENGKSRCEYSIIDGVWVDYEPAWHTGQLIFALSRAHDITQNSYYLESAQKAANWWCNLQITDNPPLNGMLKAIHGDGIEYIVFSTVSDGTGGLFHLYKKTGEPSYAEIPSQAGKWMYENMYIPEKGLCYDMADPKTGEIQKKRSAFWPDKEIQDLNDVARPNNEGSLFLDMYKFNKNEKYREAFINLSNSLVEKQGSEGLWMDFTPNDKSDNSIHPRFNLWYAESLLDAWDFTGDRKYLEGALKTAQMYNKLQQKDGTFFYTNFTDGTPPEKGSVSGSTVAFAGIIYLRLVKAGYASEFEKNVEKCFEWLVKNTYAENHPDPNLRGAFVETKVRMTKGKTVVFNRDVGTVFAVRFLADYYDFLTQKK